MGLIAAKKRNEVRRRKILFVAVGGDKTVSYILLPANQAAEGHIMRAGQFVQNTRRDMMIISKSSKN
jgi:hypothetical protein